MTPDELEALRKKYFGSDEEESQEEDEDDADTGDDFQEGRDLSGGWSRVPWWDREA